MRDGIPSPAPSPLLDWAVARGLPLLASLFTALYWGLGLAVSWAWPQYTHRC
jgi:hypothetical protein